MPGDFNDTLWLTDAEALTTTMALPRGNCQETIPSHTETDYIEMSYLAIAFLVGGPLNLIALTKLNERRRTGGMTRLLLLKMHLNFTDLMVVFIYTTSKICWLMTYQWRGGPVLCPLVLYLHSVSFYISSFVIVCIALDRLGTVFLPIYHTGSHGCRHVRWMLIGAWSVALVAAIPQLMVWRAYSPYEGRRFTQCITIWQIRRFEAWCAPVRDMEEIRKFPYQIQEIHFIAHIVLTFWLPALIAILCYTAILCWVCRNLGRKSWYRQEIPEYRLKADAGISNEMITELPISRMRKFSVESQRLAANYVNGGYDSKRPSFTPSVNERLRLNSHALSLARGSDPFVAILKAKRKILRSTLLIVSAYIIFWLPYNFLTLLELIDRERYANIENDVYWLWGLIVFNSVINPLLYGGVFSWRVCPWVSRDPRHPDFDPAPIADDLAEAAFERKAAPNGAV